MFGVSGETWFSISFGLLVAVVLFVLQMRRAASAQKERIARANNEIVQSSLRVFASFRDEFNDQDLEKLISAKSRAHGVEKSLLYSSSEVLEDVYVNVLENEYLKQEDRSHIKAKIDNVYDSALLNDAYEEFESIKLSGGFWGVSAIAITSGLFGIVAASVSLWVMISNGPDGISVQSDWTGDFASLFAAAGVALIAAIATRYMRDSLEEKQKSRHKKEEPKSDKDNAVLEIIEGKGHL